MSLKLNGAYRTGSMSLNAFNRWCERLRSSAIPLAEQGFATTLAVELCARMDRQALGFESGTCESLMSTWSVLTQKALEDPVSGDFDWSLTLQALTDSRHTYLLADYRYERFSGLLKSKPDLAPYDYQNATDIPPQGVTSEEWLKRGRDWARLLNKPTLAECGVKAQIVDRHHYCFPSAALVRRQMPPNEVRSMLVTTEKEILDLCDVLKSEFPDKPTLLYREAKRRVMAESNAEQLKAKILRNATLLPDLKSELG